MSNCRECMGTGGIGRLETCDECKGTGKDHNYVAPPSLEELQATISRQAAEIERLQKVTNFSEAVACVFDNLKIAAANTGNRAWDDQLEEFAEDVIEYAPEYKRQWRDITKLMADLHSANADKEAYAQNAIDLRQRLDNAIELLYESPVAHSRIEKLILK